MKTKTSTLKCVLAVAIGLRYEVFDGFKVSGAVGRGGDRSFGQIGFAWEF